MPRTDRNEDTETGVASGTLGKHKKEKPLRLHERGFLRRGLRRPWHCGSGGLGGS